MKLLRLILKGFKSFADPAAIEFAGGLTVIVGPNGCGKSNISDAVRWVLGEQNVRNLRGEKAEDLIFSGSASRKPRNGAEVTLVLDNSAGELPLPQTEVAITRRILRSGDSEYRIGKTACRLKDIQELLAPTGLGKGTLAIIGQNRVDQVLTARPEERRLIFEEVAGISLYRMRKNEGLRKLAKTAENRARIEDLMAAEEGRLAPMKEEADKAHAYHGLMGEKRQISATMYLLKLTSTARMTARYEHEREELKEKDAAAEARLAEAALARETLSKQFVDHQGEMQDLGSRLSLAREKRETLRGDYRVKEEALRSLMEKAKELAEEEEDQAAAERELAEETAAAEKELAQAREELAGRETAKKQAEQEKSALEQQLADSEKAYAERAALSREKLLEKEKLTGDLSHVREEQQRLAGEREKEAAALSAAEKELAAISKTLEKQKQEIEAASTRLSEVEGRGRRHSTAFTEAQNRRFALLNEEGKIRSALSAATSKREYLERAAREWTDFSRTTKVVMENSSRFGQAIHGVLGSLITVPDELAMAAEAALGTRISNIVVGTTADAQAIIGWLKQERLGRATFYPLESMHGRPEEMRVPGILGTASRLFHCDPRYQNLLDNLLGRTLVAEDLTAARRVAAACHYRLRIVTLDGQVVNAGGSMSGGSMRKGENTYFGRRRELTRLRGEEETLRRQLADMEKQRKGVEEEADRLAETVSAEREEWQEKNRSLSALRGALAASTQAREGKEKEKKEIAARQEGLQQSLTAAAAEAARLTGALAAFQELPDPGEDTDSAALRSKVGKKQEELLRLSVAVTKAEEKVRFGDRMMEDRRQAAREQKEDREALDKAKRDNAAGQAAASADMKQLQAAFEAADKEAAALAAQQADLSDAASDFTSRQKEADTAWQKAQALASSLKRDLEDRELRIAHFQEEEAETRKRLAEEGLTEEEAEGMRLSGSMDDMKRRLETLNGKLNALGTVNPKAEEDYQAELKKKSFYEDQLSDMAQAENGLQDLVHSMDTSMAAQFSGAFRKINEEFGRIMKIMFQGGSAKLELTDEKHPLESGIELYLTLPGKKRQPMSLMSGGERALTVIALLVSFMAYRPAPFCFVDEIDAALDEANVERYARMLHSYRDKCQFIVISHRKKTMEYADTLQGVTMAEKGVSSLISVRMKDYVE